MNSGHPGEIIGHDGATYVSRDEAMRRFNVRQGTFDARLARGLVRYRFAAKAGKHVYFLLTDLEKKALTPRASKYR